MHACISCMYSLYLVNQGDTQAFQWNIGWFYKDVFSTWETQLSHSSSHSMKYKKSGAFLHRKHLWTNLRKRRNKLQTLIRNILQILCTVSDTNSKLRAISSNISSKINLTITSKRKNKTKGKRIDIDNNKIQFNVHQIAKIYFNRIIDMTTMLPSSH